MRGGDIESGNHKDNRGSNYTSSAVAQREERQWTSWLIPMFIVANIAMFVVVMFVNNCPNNIDQDHKCFPKFLGRFSFQPFSENPLLGPSASTLRKLGALEWSKVVHENQQWRLISCIWLHAGLIHIISNMLSLAFIGIRLEQQCGFVRIGLIYLLSGLGGTILSSLFIQKNISVGASGALFGLLGAMLSELIANWTMYSNKVAALLTLLVIVVINLAVGILPHVDNFAHIGGFLTGFLLGFILLPRPQYGWLDRASRPANLRVKSKYKTYQYVLWVISFVLLVAGLSVGLVMLFRGVNGYEHCHWCHYLSCVPTSRWKCDST